MAYIGRGTENISNVEVLDNLTFNGSASYTLQKSSTNFVPSSANNLLISISGVVQQGNFTVSGSTITFDTTVASSDTCDWILHYGTGLITTVADGAITEAKLGSGAVTNAKLANSSITLNGSAVSLGGSATIAGGKIGQVINVHKTNTETSSSTSYVSVGMDITITPSATSSKVLLMFYPRLGCNTGSANVYMKIRNNTAGSDVISDPLIVSRWPSDGQSAYYTQPQPMVVLDSPNTSSAVQYKMQIKTNAGAWTLNMPANTGGYSDPEVSTIIAMEVSA
tara:strand:- start:571 stop:1410 length:840 start_codon:yes stop_codon:yes gene_type:complete